MEFIKEYEKLPDLPEGANGWLLNYETYYIAGRPFRSIVTVTKYVDADGNTKDIPNANG